MIEKAIHYCRFGKGELSEKEKACISSWLKVHPDWKIVRWDEHNFPVDQFKFTKLAYEKKKYAFVSDYARMYALRDWGGIPRYGLRIEKIVGRIP